MTKEDLSLLNKEQLERVLLSIYEQMDKRAKENKKAADKIGIEEDPGYGVYHNALRTMCNYTNNIVALEIKKLRIDKII